MTLPEYTLSLLQERYSEKAMRDWQRQYRYGNSVRAFTEQVRVFAAAAERCGLAASELAAIFNTLTAPKPRPVYAPLSPLTLRLLGELYGGTE